MSPGSGTPRRRRRAGLAIWTLGIASLALLGALWHRDRARVWPTPVLGAPLVLLRPAPAESSTAPAGPGAGTWLVAVNPDCPHCLISLARLAAAPPPGSRVGALVVDTPRPPDRALLATLPAAPVWWDARGDWRRRWGHRIYGEALCFDSRGRYLCTRPPE